MKGCLIALLPMLSNLGVNMALIHPNEWQIMLKSERLTRDFQMACFQHADSSKKPKYQDKNLFIFSVLCSHFKKYSILCTRNDNSVAPHG